VPEFIVEKGKITDNHIMEHMQHTAPAVPEQDFPAGSTIVKPEVSETRDNEIAFLKDVQQNPESGIAARYKRLGLSVRQGQKLKAKLSEDNLIEERQETTKNGRLIIVKLTGKGWQVLKSL
jgi:hypothetical protein